MNKYFRNMFAVFWFTCLFSLLVACGGGTGSTEPPNDIGTNPDTDTNAQYSVSVNVIGLSGSVQLTLSRGETLTILADGRFTFKALLKTGERYAVTVSSHPDAQVCVMANSAGTIVNAHVSDIAVTCSTRMDGYQISGNASGFTGLLKLRLNDTEELSLTYSGRFNFATPIASGANYQITIDESPAGYVCTVANGTGVIASADYPFVDVACVKAYTGTAVGVDPDRADLRSGETMVVNLNGIEDLTLSQWSFLNKFFKTRLKVGMPYVVSIKTHPPGKICHLSNRKGVIVESVTPIVGMDCAVDSTLSYSLGGSVSGLITSGLVLSLDGSELMTIDANASNYTFANPILGSVSHTLAIESQPVGQICSLSKEWIWTITDVADANIICSRGPYSIGGYVAGLKTPGLELQLNNSETMAVPADGHFTFDTLFSEGMNYKVSISRQPNDQVCSVHRAEGWGLSASVTDVIITCVDMAFSVKVNVAGYSSTTPLQLQLNGDAILLASYNTIASYSSPFVFDKSLKDGQAYTVSILAQPEGQLCSLTNPVGMIAGMDVSNVAVDCQSIADSAGPYTVGLTVSGLLGSGLILQLNEAADQAVSENVFVRFGTALENSASYTISVLQQPTNPIQVCQVSGATGTIAGADITQASVMCRDAVQSLYSSNGHRWLDYVKNDGVNTYMATDTACDPMVVDPKGYASCLNGGEFVAVELPERTDCIDVTASDDLNAFNWVCDDRVGVRVISTGLREGVSLSDLVDFNEGQFKLNFVSINDGVTTDTTQAGIWWDNPVRINNIGDYIKSHEIILVTGSVPSSYVMTNNSALLVAPSFAISGLDGVTVVAARAKNFLWFEGHIDSALTDAWGCINWSASNFSLMNNVQALHCNGTGVSLRGNNNKLSNIVANNIHASGIDISGSGYDVSGLTANNNLGYYGINLSVNDSVLTGLTANDNSNASGVIINSPNNVSLTNVTAYRNGSDYNHYGIGVLGTGSNSSFTSLTANDNGNDGIYIDAISDSQFTHLKAHGNAADGVYLGSAWFVTGSPVSQINTSSNGARGLYVFRWNEANIDQVVSTNNVEQGVLVSQVKKLILSNASSSNNGGHGFALEAITNTASVNLMAVNNGGSGIAHLVDGSHNLMLGASAINNGGNGFEFTRMSFL